MAGIGEKRERSGDETTDDLGDHEAAGQDSGDRDLPLIRAMGMAFETVIVGVVGVIVVRMRDRASVMGLMRVLIHW